MSWGLSQRGKQKDIVAALDAQSHRDFPAATNEAREQIDAALKAAGAILVTVVPDPEGEVTVSLSGHANPGHAKTEGWSRRLRRRSRAGRIVSASQSRSARPCRTSGVGTASATSSI